MAHTWEYSNVKRRLDEVPQQVFEAKRQRPNGLFPTDRRQPLPLMTFRPSVQPGSASAAFHNQRGASTNHVNRVSTLSWQYVTDAITHFASSNVQNNSLFRAKFALRDALYEIISEIHPDCGLYIVGSSVTGFGGSNSDMDLCLMIGRKELGRTEVCSKLDVIMRALRRCKLFERLLLIRAKVPILTFSDPLSGVQCDLNINNSVGIRNTHLLHSYCQLDPRVRVLGLFVKRWAKAQNINDAKSATISSYSLILMVIHYLQFVCSPPILPSLQLLYPNTFSMANDVKLLQMSETPLAHHTDNKQPVGELFCGFLKYFAHDFEYSTTAISVRLGKTLPRSMLDETADLTNCGQRKPLYIEEPFDKCNTARSVYDTNIFRRIIHVFRRSLQELQRTKDVKVILNTPM